MREKCKHPDMQTEGLSGQCLSSSLHSGMNKYAGWVGRRPSSQTVGLPSKNVAMVSTIRKRTQETSDHNLFGSSTPARDFTTQIILSYHKYKAVITHVCFLTGNCFNLLYQLLCSVSGIASSNSVINSFTDT